MAKSLERQVKDAIIEKLGDIASVASVSTSGRGLVVAESDLSSGAPAVFLYFPVSKHEGGCGFEKVIVPVAIEAKFRFDGDVDAIDLEDVRDTLDSVEQDIRWAITEDRTWGGLAFDTREDRKVHKQTSEDANTPEAILALYFEVEIHYRTGDLFNAF